jgi:hypothetical protein
MSVLSTSTRLMFLEELGYLPRVNVRDGRAIEQALAGPDLLQSGVQLSGAIVEASLAHHDSGFLKLLHECGVQYLVDAQVLRFADGSYQDVERIARLPFAPRAAITTAWDANEISELVRGVFEFQDAHGASARLTIAPPLRDEHFERWLDLHRRMLDASIALNGRGGFERKPLLAYLAPGRHALANLDALLARLADLPLDGVYLQPLRLSPTTDGIEKLVLYVRLLQRLEVMGLPAVAGRVGAFGLALLACGARAFDSGLGEAERFSLADLGGFDGLAGRARQHYLWVKIGEVTSLASAPTQPMRLEQVHRGFREARDLSTVVTRVLGDHELPAPHFEHLDRWLAVLSRSTTALHEAA